MQQVRADGTAAAAKPAIPPGPGKNCHGFDHSKTSFPLLGAHRATACMDCHKPPNQETRLINVDFKAAPSKCEECHEDIHGGQFAQGEITPCAQCHNSAQVEAVAVRP